MARIFDDANPDYLTGTAPITSDTLTISAWFKADDENDTGAIVSIANTTPAIANDSFILVAESQADNELEARVDNQLSAGGGLAETTTFFTINTWSHACGLYQKGTNKLVAYLEGSVFGSGTDTFTITPSSVDTIAIGAHVNKIVRWEFSGSIAEVAIWNIALALLDVQALAKGFSPLLIHPGSLVFYAPLLRGENVDYISGISLSETGSPTTDDHPRIFRPAPQSFHGF